MESAVEGPIMESIRELLRAGPGPSSSHTIGPYRAALLFRHGLAHEPVVKVRVTLCGSLALTGQGHGTDAIVKKALEGLSPEVVFDFETPVAHPNTIIFSAELEGGETITRAFESIGGGAIKPVGQPYQPRVVYPFRTFDGLKAWMEAHGETDVYRVIEHFEGESIFGFGSEMLQQSFDTLSMSLRQGGILPGRLQVQAVARQMYQTALKLPKSSGRRTMLISAFAYAVSEANARGEKIVTAPTCGAAGVVPAVLYYQYRECGRTFPELVKAFLVGALVCVFAKEEAGISGAVLGCQAEIGSAASFAAAALCYLDGLSVGQIEYGAEVAMEHFLGLTCDPVDGYVQIPCIERNGMAAIHAYTAYLYAKYIAPYKKAKVSFDDVLKAMKETGEKMSDELRETGLGGLARVVKC